MSEIAYVLVDENNKIEIVNCLPEELDAVMAEVDYNVTDYGKLKNWIELNTMWDVRKDSYVRQHKAKKQFEQFKQTVMLATELLDVDSWTFSWGEVFTAQFDYVNYNTESGYPDGLRITYDPNLHQWSWLRMTPDQKDHKGTGSTILAANTNHYQRLAAHNCR